MGSDSPIEPEPHINNNTICFVGDQIDEQAVNNGPDAERPKNQGEELDEGEPRRRKEPRPVFLSACLTKELKDGVLTLLREFQDVFAWTYGEMPGLDSRLVTHKLNIKEGTKPLKQAPQHFRPELEEIKQEIQKLFKVGFIKPIQHPT